MPNDRRLPSRRDRLRATPRCAPSCRRAIRTSRSPNRRRCSSGAELVALLRGHDRAIVGLERIDDAVLAQVPELKVISKYGVGLDGIDLEAIARRGIKLAWTGGVNRRSVAELTLAFAIALLHRVPEDDRRASRRVSGRNWSAGS